MLAICVRCAAGDLESTSGAWCDCLHAMFVCHASMSMHSTVVNRKAVLAERWAPIITLPRNTRAHEERECRVLHGWLSTACRQRCPSTGSQRPGLHAGQELECQAVQPTPSRLMQGCCMRSRSNWHGSR